MSKLAATEDVLGSLHSSLASSLSEAMEGEPVLDSDGTFVGKKFNTAAMSVARQFLKDNNIQATVENKAMANLVSSLPDFDNNPELINLANYRP